MKKVIILNLVLLMVLSVGCASSVTQDKPLIGITSTYSASSSGSRRAPGTFGRDPNSFRRNFTRQTPPDQAPPARKPLAEIPMRPLVPAPEWDILMYTRFWKAAASR